MSASDVVEIGDIVQYVWGMPGPDYDEGRVCVIHDDGSFDVEFGAGTMAFTIKNAPYIYARLTLSDRAGPTYIGYCAKVTRPGVNGF